MAKKEVAKIKLQIPAGAANPSPPVGPALGQHGLNIMEFCKAFNAKTMEQKGTITPVIITVYSDRSFTFITKTPPASVLLIKAAKIEKGSGVPNQGWHGDDATGRRYCPFKAARSHCQKSRCRCPEYSGHSPQHGH